MSFTTKTNLAFILPGLMDLLRSLPWNVQLMIEPTDEHNIGENNKRIMITKKWLENPEDSTQVWDFEGWDYSLGRDSKYVVGFQPTYGDIMYEINRMETECGSVRYVHITCKDRDTRLDMRCY